MLRSSCSYDDELDTDTWGAIRHGLSSNRLTYLGAGRSRITTTVGILACIALAGMVDYFALAAIAGAQ